MSKFEKRTWRWTALFAGLLLVAGFVPLVAEEPAAEEMPGDLASSWIMWVKPGQEAEFEAGLKAHAAWRKEAGEGFVWNIYQPVVGDDMAHYVIRSGSHHWADFDAQSQWEQESGALAKYMEQMGGYVKRVEHFIVRLAPEHSNWTDSDEYRLYGVSRLRLEPGAYGRMTDALGKLRAAAVEQGWPRSFAISWEIGGPGRMIVVTPFKSWADMEEPETPFMKMLADSLGSPEAARETMEQLQGSFEKSDYTIYQARPDLSTPR